LPWDVLPRPVCRESFCRKGCFAAGMFCRKGRFAAKDGLPQPGLPQGSFAGKEFSRRLKRSKGWRLKIWDKFHSFEHGPSPVNYSFT